MSEKDHGFNHSKLEMKKIIILTIFLFVFLISGSAQYAEGVIVFNRKTDWISILEKMPYMSQEEVDRVKLTWGNNSSNIKGTNYELFIKNDKTLYTQKEEDIAESGWSRRKEKYLLIRDYKKKTIKDLKEELGKVYVVKDEIPKVKWKILNEIKEVAGYLCMKAETKDPVKDRIIHAWFTDAIAMSGGPEGYGGLPGMILELDINDGDAIISATNVDLEIPIEKLPIPKKMKGKEITQTELDVKIKDFIQESIEGRKNPFWRIRY